MMDWCFMICFNNFMVWFNIIQWFFVINLSMVTIINR